PRSRSAPCFGIRTHCRGVPFCAAHGADPRSAASSRPCQPGGDALFRLDADFCRAHPTWKRRDAWHVDWRDGHRRIDRRSGVGIANGAEGIEPLGGSFVRGIWGGADTVFVLAMVLALRNTAGTCGLCDDGADGIFEYIDSGDGARPFARANDGGLFDDVHGHGPARVATLGGARRSRWCTLDGGHRWSGGHHRRIYLCALSAETSCGSAATNYRARSGGRGTSRRYDLACLGIMRICVPRAAEL